MKWKCLLFAFCSSLQKYAEMKSFELFSRKSLKINWELFNSWRQKFQRNFVHKSLENSTLKNKQKFRNKFQSKIPEKKSNFSHASDAKISKQQLNSIQSKRRAWSNKTINNNSHLKTTKRQPLFLSLVLSYSLLVSRSNL